MSPLDRRGTFANTAVWTCALVAIAGLTVWKFEIWPVGWVATETGTLDESEVHSDRFAAAPIEVAGPASEIPRQAEPASGGGDHGPPPAELAALNLPKELPASPDRKPPQWPQEPGRLPVGDSMPLRSSAPAPLPTGSDFAATGEFPEATAPPTAPPQQAEPASLEVPARTTLQPAAGETETGPPHATTILPMSGQSVSSESSDGQRLVEGALPSQAAAGIVRGRHAPGAALPKSGPSPTQLAANATGISSPPRPAEMSDPRLVAIDADIAANRYLAAHKSLSKLYWDEPRLRPAIQTRIDKTATSIYFDPQPHYMAPYEVQPGDQLRVFAREYDVPWEYLVRVNRIDDPGRIKAGQRLKVIKGPFAAVVSLSDFTLTVHAHGYYVRRYPIGVGKDGTTPIGVFHVVLKEADPKYWGPDGVVMERDDPANPLGERWIGLDDGTGRPTSYGIHGTIDPGSIGKAESRGCVRLRNEDVAEVYDLLGVGSEVVIKR